MTYCDLWKLRGLENKSFPGPWLVKMNCLITTHSTKSVMTIHGVLKIKNNLKIIMLLTYNCFPGHAVKGGTYCYRYRLRDKPFVWIWDGPVWPQNGSLLWICIQSIQTNPHISSYHYRFPKFKIHCFGHKCQKIIWNIIGMKINWDGLG